MVAETNTDGHIRISYFLSTVPNRNPPQWPPQNDSLLPFSISVIIFHRYYWMKCTEPTLLEACSPGAFKCLSPVGSVECKGSKWPSPCSLKCISTQITNPISANTKPDYSFSISHPSNSAASTHSKKVLGLPSSCSRAAPWSALPRASCPDPTVPRVDQMLAELSNSSISEMCQAEVMLCLFQGS